MRSLLITMLLVAALAVPSLAAQTPALPQATAAPVAKRPPAQAATNSERGERVFQANCSRCHNPPDALNPRITGTVVRHMRVRANLSASEERDILRYLNP